MATDIWVGVSGKARKAKDIWVGVGGKARKVVRAWVGVGGKARLCYEGSFWTAGGISSANCLAAYQFKGASSATEAKKDLTGHGYTLTQYNQPAWSAANGFYVDTINGNNITLANSTLNTKAIKSIVIRYAGFSGSSQNDWCISRPYGASGYAVLWADGGQRASGSVWPGTSSSWTNNPVIRKNASTLLWASTGLNATGVVGMTLQSAIYKNGTAMTLTSVTESQGHASGTGGGNYTLWFPKVAGYKIYAAAFYDINLTAAQHKAVADAMLDL